MKYPRELFDENFFSFVSTLGGAPGGALLRLSHTSLAAASGQPHAGENYALFAENSGEAEVKKALAFFNGRKAGFAAPRLLRTPEEAVRALEENGAAARRIYTSMYLPPENMPEAGAPEVKEISEDDAAKWGEAAWYAFGGEDGAEAVAYIPFGVYLAEHGSNRAFALQDGGVFASTALIHETRNTFGLYYFATLPDRRRRGFAQRLMDGVTAALAGKKPLFLLATEAGLPFYTKYGFKTLDKVPVYSQSDDI